MDFVDLINLYEHYREEKPVLFVQGYRVIKIQDCVNGATALTVLIGGLAVALFYPGSMETQYRILIGIFVSLYFLLRIGQVILAIKRRRLHENDRLGIGDSSGD